MPAVEIPSELEGTYSGQLPCDNCKAQTIRATLSADSNVTIIRTLVVDSMVVDTLQGAFSLNADSVIAITVGDGRFSWKFKRSSLGNLALLNGAGDFYVDEDGLKSELVRVYAKPKTKPASTDTSSSEKVVE